jgi:hypothetical protein
VAELIPHGRGGMQGDQRTTNPGRRDRNHPINGTT